MKTVMILGATGSIGSSVLSVLRDNPGDFRVAGLAAGRWSDKLAALAREFPDAAVACSDSAAVPPADSRGGRFHFGPDGALAMIAGVKADICVAAVSGTAGLGLAFAAARRKTRLLLANKEVLVSAGRLFMETARAGGAEVLPVDSEHTALWQCLEGRASSEVEKLHITASGGPFLTWTAEAMASAGPRDALKHPVWRMGAKISVDSATLANKALELIEAHHLFGLPYDAMTALVHPQSAVHAIAEFVDGSLIAHMGVCDMRQPISYMLFYPERRRNSLPRLDLTVLRRLDFAKPDTRRFPMLALGVEAGRRGGKYPALYNAANEAAVELFLDARLSFPGIARAVEAVMEDGESGEFSSLAEVEETHARARRAVLRFAEHRG